MTVSILFRAKMTPIMNSKNRVVTLKDIALETGLSFKTVSRVLRDEPNVSPATAALVQAAAKRLGYVPHASARNLASAVPNVISMVQFKPFDLNVTRSGYEYFMGMLIGVLDACRKLEIGTMVVDFDRDKPSAVHDLISLVRQRQVGGYVIPAPVCDIPGLCATLLAEGIPFSSISPADTLASPAWVCVDEAKAMRALVEHLIDMGHRRIGTLVAEADTRAARQRFDGYLQAMHAHGLPVEPAWIVQSRMDFDSGRNAAHMLFRLPQPPSAIVACSDDCAAGVIAAAQERGIDFPSQLSVTGYTDADLARKIWPGITTVHQPLSRMAALATQQVAMQMQPHRVSLGQVSMQQTLEAKLVHRGSVLRCAQWSTPSSSQ